VNDDQQKMSDFKRNKIIVYRGSFSLSDNSTEVVAHQGMKCRSSGNHNCGKAFENRS